MTAILPAIIAAPEFSFLTGFDFKIDEVLGDRDRVVVRGPAFDGLMDHMREVMDRRAIIRVDRIGLVLTSWAMDDPKISPFAEATLAFSILRPLGPQYVGEDGNGFARYE